MDLAESPVSRWQARLALGFERRGETSTLVRRQHYGPLRVQKALYPEGPGVCHAIVLHPPSGIAGGDQLEIEARLETGAHALLTTPGAGKWYRSAGPGASQRLDFKVAAGAVLEWLPQETIVFNGARAAMSSAFELAGDAAFIGWELLCLGRRAAGERFGSGTVGLETRVTRMGRPIWLERGHLDAGASLMASPAGLAGYSVCGTLLACGQRLDAELLNQCRRLPVAESDARHGITLLPEVFVARYLGHSSEAGRQWFTALWRALRPALLAREALTPRIWNT